MRHRSLRIKFLSIYMLTAVSAFALVLASANQARKSNTRLNTSGNLLRWQFQTLGKAGSIYPSTGHIITAPSFIRGIVFAADRKTVIIAKSSPRPASIQWRGPIELWERKRLQRTKVFGRIKGSSYANLVLTMSLSPAGRVLAVLHPNKMV